MSSQAPWSIKGVDKETREKMKQMAQQQGMSLADFLETLMNVNNHVEREIKHSISIQQENHISDHYDDDERPNIEEISNDIVLENQMISLDNSLDDKLTQPKIVQAAYSETHEERSNSVLANSVLATDDSVADTHQENINALQAETKTQASTKNIPHNTNNAPKNTTIVEQKHRPRKKSSATETSQKSASSTKGTTTLNLFNRLTQKAGITNSALAEVATHDISETVMRERQLRDMMRVQMAEMKQMFNQLLEEAVDKKFDDIKSLFNQSLSDNSLSYHQRSENGDHSEHVVSQAIHNLVSKEDFIDVISQMTLEIDNKIDTKFQQQLDTIHELNQKSCQTIHEGIEKITTNLDNPDNSKISQLINEAITNHAFSQSDLSGGDLAIFSALKDNADVLSSRMARIEDVCTALDGKLTHLQSDVSYTLQPENHNQSFQELHQIKAELEEYVKSIPDYLDSALKKNSSDMTPIVNTLQMTSERVLKLEAMVKTLASKVERESMKQSALYEHSDKQAELSFNNKNYSKASYEIQENTSYEMQENPPHEQESQQDNISRHQEIDHWDDEDTSEVHHRNEKNFNNLYSLDDIDNPQHHPHDFLSDSEDIPHDIREMDRDAFLSGTRKKFEKKMSEKKNDINKQENFIDQIGGTKNLILFGTMGVTVFILLTLVFQ